MHIVDAYPKPDALCVIESLWQYDSGQAVRINYDGLPYSYHVNISNSAFENADDFINTGNVVEIGKKYLQSGNPVYIWIAFVDEDSTTTVLAMVSYIKGKSKPIPYEPTQDEQTAYDRLIKILNDSVERSETAQLKAENAAESIPQIIEESLFQAKNSGEFDGPKGQDGVSPTVAIMEITGGHRITITDKVHPNGQAVDVLDGSNGRGIVSVEKTGTSGLTDTYTITYTDSTTSTFTVTNGQDGTPGADGTTFTPTVSAEGVISWTNNGGKTNPQPANIKGTPGNDGTSPTVSVADITGGHRVTVTDANGTRSFDVMDGDDYTLTAADKAEIAQQAAGEVDVPVQDVQVNGTSILSNGVANVPVASSNTLGVVKINSSDGVGISNNALFINGASSNNIKGGTNNYRPVVPAYQHESTFYGLSKAAGADMASSSNAVGVYTAQAKAAIWNMLGLDGSAFVKSEWELIREDTVTHATSELLDITTDDNGQPFELTDIRLIFRVPKQDTDFIISDYANVTAYHVNGTNRMTMSLGGANPVTIPANSNARAAVYCVETEKGMSKMSAAQLQNESGRVSEQIPLYYSASSNYKEFLVGDNAFNKVRIASFSGTLNYRLYGKRKRAALDSPVINVSGSTPSITALPGHRYVCGEVATLDITLPASGIVDVVFTSGSTATVLTITPPTGQTVKWANGFDLTSLDANTTYEINIMDGLGVAGVWT